MEAGQDRNRTGNGGASDASIADLMRDLSQQTSTLVRQEMELARVELTEKGKKAGIGAGMFGGAGAIGFYAFGALTAALIAGIAKAGVVFWLAALIVGLVYAAIAGVLALQGKNKVQQATPPVPQQAVESTKEDVEWAKTSAKQARQ